MKKLTTNISIINPDLFSKAYSAFFQTYGYAPGKAYLSKDTLNSLERDLDISIVFEIDENMQFGEVAFG